VHDTTVTETAIELVEIGGNCSLGRKVALASLLASFVSV